MIRRLVPHAIWSALCLLAALYVLVFVPIMPFRVPCYDGDSRWLEGTPVYPYKGALLWAFASYRIDYTVHFGSGFEWKPKTDRERLSDDVLNWRGGVILIRYFDWLYDEGDELTNASATAVSSLLFEGYGADPDEIPDHIKEMLEGGLTRLRGPYVHTDCELTRAVAFDWHKDSLMWEGASRLR